MDRKEFFDTYAPYAQAEQMRYGIPASITLAQMWLESGGGSSYLAREGNNFFGIKAKGNWKGDVLYANDDKKHEAFRKYDNVQDSIRNHSMFLLGNRYQKQCGHLAVTDYKGWAQGIKAAGYATDPQYASKLIDVIEKNHLNDYDRNAVTVSSDQCGVYKSQYLLEDAAKYGNSPFGMPLRNSETLIMASDFGKRNINNGSSEHEGIDLRAAKGTDIYASESGIVLTTGKQDVQSNVKAGGGNYVYVAYPRADGTYRVAVYMHLDSINVKAGDQVNADTIIAKSGNSGGVKDHLHFGVAKVDKKEDINVLNEYISNLPNLLPEEQKGKWENVRIAALGDHSGGKYGHYYDAKEYLAEIATAGNLKTRLEDKHDPKKEDLLASAKRKVSQEDINLLVQKATSGDLEHFNIDSQLASMFGLNASGEGTGQNSILDLLKQSGVGGGGDLVSSLISMAMMLLFASMTGKPKSEKQVAAADVAQVLKGEQTAESDYTVDIEAERTGAKKGNHTGFDVKELRVKGSQMYDMIRDSQEGQEQRINQDESKGASLA